MEDVLVFLPGGTWVTGGAVDAEEPRRVCFSFGEVEEYRGTSVLVINLL